MRALLVPVAFAAALSVAPAAFAATAAAVPAKAMDTAKPMKMAKSMESTGVVKAIDLKTHKLTLMNGTVYHLPADFTDAGIKAGEKVKVSWMMEKGRHNATDVTIVK